MKKSDRNWLMVRTAGCARGKSPTAWRPLMRLCYRLTPAGSANENSPLASEYSFLYWQGIFALVRTGWSLLIPGPRVPSRKSINTLFFSQEAPQSFLHLILHTHTHTQGQPTPSTLASSTSAPFFTWISSSIFIQNWSFALFHLHSVLQPLPSTLGSSSTLGLPSR